MRITVLAGGVGAARFLDGLVRIVDPVEVTVICNVSDDFAWHGLFVCPDIDTVVYTLAGLEGPQGWGVRGDTRAALDELTVLGEDPWFLVGDRDLATHVWRTDRLRGGRPLSEVTSQLAAARGLSCTLLPVTDDPHPTVVLTEDGPLGFQDYFVRRRAADPVRGFRFPGAHAARPAPGVLDALTSADAVVFAPSNPFVSVAPILEVPGVREALAATAARRIAVTPIVGGAAVKGPAAAMLAALGHEVSTLAVARLYARLVDTFVLDAVDAGQAPAIEALGLRVCVTDTMMTSVERRAALARAVLEAAFS
ncbi:MAG: 2-phospho-L-lactate transferase [Dehalococcoidia bacterium]